MSAQNDPPEESDPPTERAELVARWGERELGVRAASRTSAGVVRATRLLLATGLALAGLVMFLILTLDNQQVAAYVALAAGMVSGLAILLIHSRT